VTIVDDPGSPSRSPEVALLCSTAFIVKRNVSWRQT
jgi:hypothetical protein